VTTSSQETVHLCGRDIPRPGHVCAFFDSRDEEYSVLLPYLREGVMAGEDVLNVLDEARLPDHRSRLAGAGIHADRGHVSLASSEDTYLVGGRFDMERMVTFVEDTVANAKANGRRVRTAGWMGWLQAGAPGTDRAMEYEARMNYLVPKYDCTFMCVYDLAQLGGPAVVDIIATHPWVILNGRIRENPKYIPPEIYLAELLKPPRGISPTL
jgi:hypothetical protein